MVCLDFQGTRSFTCKKACSISPYGLMLLFSLECRLRALSRDFMNLSFTEALVEVAFLIYWFISIKVFSAITLLLLGCLTERSVLDM